MHSLYPSRGVRYTIFRATKTRGYPTRFLHSAARATPGYRMHKIIRGLHTLKTRGRLEHLLAWRQRLYDTGRYVRQASERARSLSGGSPRSAGRRTGLEARAVLLGNLSVEVDYRGAATRQSRRPPTPFSALFVSRQRDTPKAFPPGNAPIQPRLRSGRIFC